MKQAGIDPALIYAFEKTGLLITEGRVNSRSSEVSIARMKSPSGWSEPRQTPEFDEYTLVLRGSLHVQLKD